MPELTPIEKLQPCLLDRLIDEDPGAEEESSYDRIISISRYKEGVLRDLQWLINASAFLPATGPGHLDIDLYPEAKKSVINYGIRHLCGLIAPDLRELEKAISDAVHIFEPRILPNSLELQASKKDQEISFQLRGEVWANPMPEELFMKTIVDLETGACEFGDYRHG